MTAINVRRASLADLDTIAQFHRGVVLAERPFDSTLKSGDIRYYDLEGLLRADNVWFGIAEVEGVPAGCGFVRIDTAKPYLNYPRVGYLGLMYVEPAHRGRGVNGLIIEALKAHCRERGVFELHLDVYPDNASAVRAYQKVGFVPYMLEMRMALKE
jgi:GNAT superfamily N-acetyltransferase